MFSSASSLLLLAVALLLSWGVAPAAAQTFGYEACTLANCQAADTFTKGTGNTNTANYCTQVKGANIFRSFCKTRDAVLADYTSLSSGNKNTFLRNMAVNTANAETHLKIYNSICRPECVLGTKSSRVPNGCYCGGSCLDYGDCCVNYIDICLLPSISSISPSTGNTTGNYPLTISGVNHFPAESTMRVIWGYGYNSTNFTAGAGSASDGTSTVMTVPTGVGTNIPIVIYVTSAKISNSEWFSYSPPVITSVSPTEIPTAGAVVTVNGQNFGQAGLTSVISSQGGTTLSFNDQTVAMTSVDHSKIVFTAPAGGASSVTMRFTVGGQSTDNRMMPYSAPTITSVTPAGGRTIGGYAITITGTNFYSSGATVRVQDTDCPVVGAHNHTVITCTMPSNMGTVAIRVTTAYNRTVQTSYDYGAPSIASWSAAAKATAGGDLLTILGDNFYTAPTVQLGPKECSWNPLTISGTSANNTVIICKIPAGEGTNLALSATAGTRTVTATDKFSYDPPSITSLSNNFGSTSGGSVMTITGINFGVSGYATINNVACTASTVTHVQILCTVAAGMGTALPVKVTVLDRSTTTSASLVFNYNAPVITAVTPLNSPTSGGGTMTITGTSFGITGLVRIGTMNCAPTGTGFTHTQILCLIPVGTGKNHAILVTVGGQSSTGSFAFSYDGPSVSSLSPATGPTGGGIGMTITGASFGLSGASVMFNGASTPATSQSHTNVYFTLPVGSGDNLNVYVQTPAGDSGMLLFSYASPTITSVSPLTGVTSGGTSITITGTSFDTSGTGSAVTLDGNTCAVTSWSHTQIICTTPPGYGASRTIRVTARTGKFATNSLFSYATPSLSTVTPSQIPTDTSTTTITLAGANFGVLSATCQVYFNNTAYAYNDARISTWNHTVILFKPPSGQGSGIIVYMSNAAGGTTYESNSRQISYLPPTITSVVLRDNVTGTVTGPTQGGTWLLITGTNFGVTTPVAYVGATACAQIIYTAHTSIQCQTPAGQGSVPIRVDAGGYSVTASTQFSYAYPVISSISSSSTTTQGGYLLTITGTSFGTSPSALVGGNVCSTAVTGGSASHTQVVCSMPAGEGTVPVMIMSGSHESNSVDFTYGAPTLTSASPLSGSTIGGNDVTITGTNFGVSPFARIGGVVCPTKNATGNPSHTQLICTMPAGSGANLIVEVVGTSFSLHRCYCERKS